MPQLVVTPKGARRLRAGHPWVFAGDLREPADAPPGLASLVGPSGELVGAGFYNPRSKLAFRLVTRGAEPVTEALIAERLRQAAAHRERAAAGWEAFRAVHSEADGLPGLTVDKYGDVLVLQQHAAALGLFTDVIVQTLTDLYAPTGVLARNDHPLRRLEGLSQEVTVLAGTVPETVPFREGDVTLLAAPYTGQKTGAFLDQRENHVYAGDLACGRVLDVFSYHGGFALQLARHAESVTAVDSSAAALGQLEAGARRNGAALTTVRGDAFGVLRGLVGAGERFATVVLDPPAFAKGRAQLPAALTGYRELNVQALKLLGAGGRLFTASCSHPVSEAAFLEMLAGAAADAGRTVRVLAKRGAAACHPEVLNLPETRYLSFVGREVTGGY